MGVVLGALARVFNNPQRHFGRRGFWLSSLIVLRDNPFSTWVLPS